VVDTLFGIIDFEKFKKIMVDLKKGFVDKTPEELKADQEGDNKLSEASEKNFEADFWNMFKEDYTNKHGEWNKKLEKSKPKEGIHLSIY